MEKEKKTMITGYVYPEDKKDIQFLLKQKKYIESQNKVTFADLFHDMIEHYKKRSKVKKNNK